MTTSLRDITDRLNKIRWSRDLEMHGNERPAMTPLLAEALRSEIRNALDANGGPFDVNVARSVYNLAMAARDMCIAATSNVKEAIDQIKDIGGPMESLDSPDTPENSVQTSETYGARLIREVLASLPMMNRQRGSDDPKALVHALAEARQHNMTDVAAELEVKLFGRVLSARIPPQGVVVTLEGDSSGDGFERGLADAHAGVPAVAAQAKADRAYRDGYYRGLTEEAIALDVKMRRTSQSIHDEIIAEVGMMADARPPEMQARYEAALLREGKTDSPTGPINRPLENGATP